MMCAEERMIQETMYMLTPGLHKCDPELAKELYREVFSLKSSDESDESEPTRKRARRGWKKRQKNNMKSPRSGLIIA